MKTIGRGLVLLAIAAGASANASADFFASFEWQNRLLLVFAPGPDDPRLRRQDETLDLVAAELADRDLRIIRLQPGAAVTPDGVAVSTPAANEVYRNFDIERHEFAVLLIGKDGTVKMKQNAPPRCAPFSI